MASLPLDRPTTWTSLDISGLVGFVGGDDAVSAMTAVQVYGNRRWVGWYNTPGSFHIAKRLDSLAKSASLCNISAADHPDNPTHINMQMDFTRLLGLDNCRGPRFRMAYPSTIIQETGYLAALFMKECAALDSESKVVPGRRTQPIWLTVADLGPAPALEVRPAHSNSTNLLSASLPIIVSSGTCAFCTVHEDWYASSLIFIGIIANGLSGIVLGSADFIFTHPEASEGSAGDGIFSSDRDLLLLRGTRGAVNSIMHGRFSLRFSSKGHYNHVRLCSVLFFIQFISQLFLIPRASSLGQCMFFISLSVSALYNAWLSLLDKEQIHRKVFFEKVLEKPTLTKYAFGNRTTAVVFILLILQLSDPTILLNELLPDNTKVWNQWKAMILQWLRQPNDQPFQPEWQLCGFAQQEKEILELFYEDARAAYIEYKALFDESGEQ